MAIEASYRAFAGRLVLKFTGESVKDVFKTLGELATVLDADTKCGMCKSEAIYPQMRTAQTFEYYELVCGACGAKLSFGQHKTKGTLWPKRSDYPNSRGWHHFTAEGEGEPEPETGRQHPPPRRASAPPPKSTKRPAMPISKPSDSLELKTLFSVAVKEGYDAAFQVVFEQLHSTMGEDFAKQCWDQSTKSEGEAALRYLHQCLVSNAV